MLLLLFLHLFVLIVIVIIFCIVAVVDRTVIIVRTVVAYFYQILVITFLPDVSQYVSFKHNMSIMLYVDNVIVFVIVVAVIDMIQ